MMRPGVRSTIWITQTHSKQVPHRSQFTTTGNSDNSAVFGSKERITKKESQSCTHVSTICAHVSTICAQNTMRNFEIEIQFAEPSSNYNCAKKQHKSIWEKAKHKQCNSKQPNRHNCAAHVQCFEHTSKHVKPSLPQHMQHKHSMHKQVNTKHAILA